MEILNILSTIINALLIILIAVGLPFAIFFIKSYIPAYIEEKAKNLATKEDVQEITRKTEEVQKEFKENFELFASDVHFKYKQYSELYCKLYGVIIQSEYIRYFLKLDLGQDISFDEAPFLEQKKLKRTHTRFNLNVETPPKEVTVEEVETPISKFNKTMLYEYIIENSQYASQNLLKLAISYRYSNTFYVGNNRDGSYSNEATANDEEFRLIRQLVCCIVSEYNKLRKELKMECDENELETGIIQLKYS